MASRRRSRPVCRSAASTTLTHRSGGWAAPRFRCRTAFRSRRPPSRRARTSNGWLGWSWDAKPMPDVNMPKLSDTMEEGTVLEWKKKDGDEGHQGDVLGGGEA